MHVLLNQLKVQSFVSLPRTFCLVGAYPMPAASFTFNCSTLFQSILFRRSFKLVKRLLAVVLTPSDLLTRDSGKSSWMGISMSRFSCGCSMKSSVRGLCNGDKTHWTSQRWWLHWALSIRSEFYRLFESYCFLGYKHLVISADKNCESWDVNYPEAHQFSTSF